MSSQGRRRRGGLWGHRDFRKLWAGETVSLFGSEVTELALPLVAVLALDAGAGQMGLLAAARFAPFLLVTLPAGVWVDRRRRRPVLIGANLGRCLLSPWCPCWRPRLLLSSTSTASPSPSGADLLSTRLPVVPAVAGRRGQLVGPASRPAPRWPVWGAVLRAAGAAAGAPRPCCWTRPSFAVRVHPAGLRHRAAPPGPAAGAPRAGLRREIGEGLTVTYRNPVLRSMAGLAATYNLFAQVIAALLVLYATTELGMAAGLIGLVVAAGSVGALAGAALTGRLQGRLGVGPALILAVVVECASLLLVPLAGGPTALAAGVLGLAFVGNGFGLGLSNVLAVSLRQAVTPDRLLGRMNASYRFLTYGAVPIGALLGGALGELLGLRAAVAVGAVGSLLTVPWVLARPLPGLRRMPAQPEPR